jgi:hypothetical protein
VFQQVAQRRQAEIETSKGDVDEAPVIAVGYDQDLHATRPEERLDDHVTAIDRVELQSIERVGLNTASSDVFKIRHIIPPLDREQWNSARSEADLKSADYITSWHSILF